MTSWARVNTFLVVLLVALVAGTGIVLVHGASPDPAQSRAAQVSARYDAVGAAARAEIAVFLQVDHRRMGPITAAVLRGATGSFRAQYAANRRKLIDTARRSRARSTGTVRAVGIGEVGPRTATVYVAADSVVRTKATRKQPATKACPHRGAGCRTYRFRLEMTRTTGGWKLAKLGFVS